MTVTIRTLAAIWRISKYLMHADGSVTDDEIKPVYDFFKTFGEMNDEILIQIMREAEDLSNEETIRLVGALDEAAKQQISDLFASIVLADGEVHEKERELYQTINEACGLPDPQSDEEEATDDDAIEPAFFIVKDNGHVELRQSENEDWNTLGAELASWVGARRVEVVRFTEPLNAITEKLGLVNHHLIFMIGVGGNRDAGDNAPATILYGGGNPFYGDIIIALESNNEYEIEGFRFKNLATHAIHFVNLAVDELLIYD